MSGPQDFFVGWEAKPSVSRRGMLAGAAGLVAGAGALGYGLSLGQGGPGDGAWDQGAVQDWTGELVRAPYPMLRMRAPDGGVSTALLGSYGKIAVRPPPGARGLVTIRASLIARGENRMLAAVDAPDWLRPAPADAPALPPPVVIDRGEAMVIGEILDAKCWFGAMRPGFGKTHKSCAALCAAGGMPLAFCMTGDCSVSGAPAAPLLLTAEGGAHGRSLLPLVADPIAAIGQLVQVDDLMQFRVARAAMRRI